MKKLILSLGILAALAAPAMAQSTYDDSAANIAAGANSGVVAPDTSNDVMAPAIDDTTTGSIAVTPSDPMSDGSFDKQRGDQGEFFGANGR